MLRLTSHKLTLALVYLHHFATFVEAAFGANAVWHAGLTTIGTQCRLGNAQSVVRAPFVATSFGMSSFRIWHNYSVFIIANCRLPIEKLSWQLEIRNWQFLF